MPEEGDFRQIIMDEAHNYGGEKLAKLYVENIVKLHGVPSRIVLDKGTQFISRF